MKKLIVILVLFCSTTVFGAALYTLPSVGDINTWGTNLNNYLNSTKEGVTVAEYGATGDGVTDDTAAINLALAVGGNVIFSSYGSDTYLVNSADLVIPSNTSLYIDAGVTLKLDGTRIRAIDADNVGIYGPGAIQALNIPTTDAFPTGDYTWAIMGVINFGSTTGVIATASDGLTIDCIEFYADGDDTHDGTQRNNRTEGIVCVNANNIRIRNCNIHHFESECINLNNGGVTTGTVNYGQWVHNNYIHDFGHDGISTQQYRQEDAFFYDNFLYDGFTAIEGLVGVYNGNIIDTMAAGGFALGGNVVIAGLTITNNTIVNIGTIGISYENTIPPIEATSGPITIQGNRLEGIGSVGVYVRYLKDITVTDNIIVDAGSTAFAILDCDRGLIANNVCAGRGTATVGIQGNATNTNVKFFNNFAHSDITTPYATHEREATDTITLSNADIKALATGTGKTLIAAQGAGYITEVTSVVLFLDYGSEVLAEPSAPDDIAINYDGVTGGQIATQDSTGFITSNADAIMIIPQAAISAATAVTAAANVNKTVNLINTGSNYTGNASADTTMTVKISYKVHYTGL